MDMMGDWVGRSERWGKIERVRKVKAKLVHQKNNGIVAPWWIIKGSLPSLLWGCEREKRERKELFLIICDRSLSTHFLISMSHVLRSVTLSKTKLKMLDQIRIVAFTSSLLLPQIPFYWYKMNNGGGDSVLTQTSAREVSIQIDF